MFLLLYSQWAEEVAIYSVIWITFLASVLCLRDGEHTRIEVFINLFPHSIRKWIEVFDYLVCFGFMALLCYHSIELLQINGAFRSAASNIPMVFVYSSILVSGILMNPLLRRVDLRENQGTGSAQGVRCSEGRRRRSMIGLMFLIFAVCMILAIPVGFSIAISATAFLFFDAGIPIFSIVQKMIDGINSFSYLALPLFVLSGAIMVYGATPA